MDTKFARKLIEKPGTATTKALFKGGHPGFFWIDWREADDDIVRMVGEAIAEPMPTTWHGTRLRFEYRGQSTEVPLNGRPGEQDLTLAALNRALARWHEIRYVTASEGGDTIAFLILPPRQWQALIGKYGDAVHKAFRKLDLQQPLFGGADISKEQVEAQIEAANPGMLGSLKLARAAFRLLTKEQSEQIRARHALSADTLPVMRPWCGDLVLSYFKDMLHSSDAISEGELARCHLSDQQLYALAARHMSDPWRRFMVSHQHGVGRIFATNERVETSSFALADGFWDGDEKAAAYIAAFPRRDLVLFTKADDPEGIAFLIAAIEAVDRSTATALSAQLFLRAQGHWQVRPWRAEERRDVPASLAQAADAGDYRTQYEWAYLYQYSGMPDKAAPIYRRAGEQAEAARIDSPDMFVNGSALLCNLADLYEHGNGVTQDYVEAHAWYRRSAAMNNFVAEYSLGNLYLNGLGVPRDIEQAKYWFDRSAKQGHEAARKALAEIAQRAS